MTARQVCELLVAAYERGTGCGESVDWSDLDTAYEAAIATLAEPDPLRQIADIVTSPDCQKVAIFRILAKSAAPVLIASLEGLR